MYACRSSVLMGDTGNIEMLISRTHRPFGDYFISPYPNSEAYIRRACESKASLFTSHKSHIYTVALQGDCAAAEGVHCWVYSPQKYSCFYEAGTPLYTFLLHPLCKVLVHISLIKLGILTKTLSVHIYVLHLRQTDTCIQAKTET